MRATLAYALRFDYRSQWFAAGRTALALATASELLCTRSVALFTPVGGASGPFCTAQPAVSLFWCVPSVEGSSM